MKTPKPGQLCTINNVVYRAKKRTNGCDGCDLDSILRCPNIYDYRQSFNPKKIDCTIKGIILKRI